MCAFLSGEGSEVEPLINALKKEPGLNGNCLRVLEDLILFAVEGGKYCGVCIIVLLFCILLHKEETVFFQIYDKSR